MFTLAFILLAVMILVTACSSGASTSTTAPSNSSAILDGATLFQERCNVCHNLSRAESAKHTSAEWKTIVDKMIGKGAQLTPDEETLVVDYLAANFGK
jgi:cytochrome c-type biogenesis protein CcmH/NrfF